MTDTADANRVNDRTDMELPRCKKSKMDALDPKRAAPTTLMVLLRRAY